MNIPAALAAAKQARQAAQAKFASFNGSMDVLANLVHELAYATAQQYTLETILHWQLEDAMSDEDILNALMDQLLIGADDDRSGRGNDVRRSHHDGVRQIINAFRR